MRRHFLLVLISLTTVGCADRTFVGGDNVKLLGDIAESPQQATLGEFDVRVPYRFGARDRIRYLLPGLLEKEGEAVVDTSGFVSIPIAGQVRIGGLTPAEAEAEVVQALRRSFVRNPIVTLNPVEINSVYVTVEGSVREPGLYPVDNQTTLVRAIASAKGLSEFAQQRRVVVFRTLGEKTYAALYDLDAIRSGQYRDPFLNPGDVIMVDESRTKRYFRDLLTLVPAISGPLIILLNR